MAEAASASIQLLKDLLQALATETGLASELLQAILGIYSMFDPFLQSGVNILSIIVAASGALGVQPSIVLILGVAITVLKTTDYVLMLGVARPTLASVQSALGSATSIMVSSSNTISHIEDALHTISSDAMKAMDAIQVDIVKARTRVAIAVRAMRPLQCRCGWCCKGAEDDASEPLLPPAVQETDAEAKPASQWLQEKDAETAQAAAAKPVEVPPQVAQPVLEKLTSDANVVISEVKKLSTVFSIISKVLSVLVTIAGVLIAVCGWIDAPQHYSAYLALAASVINQIEHSPIMTDPQAGFQQALREIPLLLKVVEDLQAQPKVLHEDIVKLNVSWETITSALWGISCLKSKAALTG